MTATRGTSERITGGRGALQRLVSEVVRVWPEHEAYLDKRFAGADTRELAWAEYVAERITAIVADDLVRAVGNYRWTCEMMLQEELLFRATGRYRHSSFAEAKALVYDDAAFMARYADGLLLSQLLWSNHARALRTYRMDFLEHLDPSADLLEVGPGHGLLLAMAAERRRGRVVGWDVSPASIAATRRALDAMGARPVELSERDLLRSPADPAFDAVVASELLEHLDRPREALDRLRGLLRPGGRLFLNIPVNSPAPDHITLWRTPEEIDAFVTSGGLEIVRSDAFPMTGKSIEQARTRGLTMTCVVVCRRADDGRATPEVW